MRNIKFCSSSYANEKLFVNKFNLYVLTFFKNILKLWNFKFHETETVFSKFFFSILKLNIDLKYFYMEGYNQIKNLKPLIQKYPHFKNISFLRVYVLIINLMISSKSGILVRGSY